MAVNAMFEIVKMMPHINFDLPNLMLFSIFNVLSPKFILERQQTHIVNNIQDGSCRHLEFL